MLYISKASKETWLDAAKRWARPFGLEEEIQDSYHKLIKEGNSEEDAAFGACYEWDVAAFSPPLNEMKEDMLEDGKTLVLSADKYTRGIIINREKGRNETIVNIAFGKIDERDGLPVFQPGILQNMKDVHCLAILGKGQYAFWSGKDVDCATPGRTVVRKGSLYGIAHTPLESDRMVGVVWADWDNQTGLPRTSTVSMDELEVWE